VVRSCVALYGKTGGWRVKKVTAWFEKVLCSLPYGASGTNRGLHRYATNGAA
jgi:hypothetical protein